VTELQLPAEPTQGLVAAVLARRRLLLPVTARAVPLAWGAVTGGQPATGGNLAIGGASNCDDGYPSLSCDPECHSTGALAMDRHLVGTSSILMLVLFETGHRMETI
jgi:hypothetical protein